MSGDSRDYSLDISEYLFRLTTESLRLLSNETKCYQSLASMVDKLAESRVSHALAQHDLETLREHLSKIPTNGSIRIHLKITKTSADNLLEAKQRLSEELCSDLTVADAISMLLFNYVVEQSASKLLSKMGIEGAGESSVAVENQPGDSGNVVPLK
ncbi:hypothetical protein [Sphingobium chlorophenolicum]|uniref:Uncharacterized protein n=1 Tax=Sphingobium chlorophenolicum TaxID=46429 RepID=A0A081RHR7_SPHCR|nr:hypothetical protein [Sphingobium chlorophenolicum]KEQ54740.1 hypothetical protein BV95_00969 [Sphingobium chlorophenolicum]